MPRRPDSPARLARALVVAEERAGVMPLRDAIAAELHRGLPESITNAEIDALARRLARLSMASLGAALTSLAREI